MNSLSRGVRNAFRNLVRTTSIVIILGLSIGLALTMLLARQAVEAKITSVKSSIGNTVAISPAGARGFEGGGEPLTTTQMDSVKSLEHVTGVTEVLQDRLDSTATNLVSAVEAGSLGRRNRGNTNSGSTGQTGQAGPAGQTPPGGGNFTPPIFAAGANTLNGSILMGGGSLTLSSGELFDPTQDVTKVLVGKDLATKNNLSVGSEFTAYGTTVIVSGIFDAGNNFSNNSVVFPLPTLQRLSSQVGNLSSATVHVDSIDNLTSTTSAIKAKLGDTADVVNNQDTSQQALAPLESIKSISFLSLIGAVVAGAVIILLTMVMIVRERRREIGVLKAIGAGNGRIMVQFMAEAVTFTMLAVVVGLIIGVFAAEPVTQVLVSSNSSTTQSGGVMTGGPGGGFRGGGQALRALGQGADSLRSIHTTLGWSILIYGLGAAIIIALLGSALPAWLIAKVRPAEVMRAE